MNCNERRHCAIVVRERQNMMEFVPNSIMDVTLHDSDNNDNENGNGNTNKLSKLALPASVFDICPDKPHNQHKTFHNGKKVVLTNGMQVDDKSFIPITTCMSGCKNKWTASTKASTTTTTTSPIWIDPEDRQTNDDDATVSAAPKQRRKVRFLIPPESAIINSSRKRRKFQRRNSPRGLVRCMKFYGELEFMNNGKKSARPNKRSVVLNIVNDNDDNGYDDDDDDDGENKNDTVVSSETRTTSH